MNDITIAEFCAQGRALKLTAMKSMGCKDPCYQLELRGADEQGKMYSFGQGELRALLRDIEEDARQLRSVYGRISDVIDSYEQGFDEKEAAANDRT